MVKSVSKSDQDIPLEADHSRDDYQFNDEIAKNPPRTPLSASMVDAPGKNIVAAGVLFGSSMTLSSGKAIPDGAGFLTIGAVAAGTALLLGNALRTAPAAVLEVATTRPETGQGILSEAYDQIDARISSAKDWAAAGLTHVFNNESAEPEQAAIREPTVQALDEDDVRDLNKEQIVVSDQQAKEIEEKLKNAGDRGAEHDALQELANLGTRTRERIRRARISGDDDELDAARDMLEKLDALGRENGIGSS